MSDVDLDRLALARRELKAESVAFQTPLRWFTGNIGYHHIHHLNARVPNYRLHAAHTSLLNADAVPALRLGSALRNHRYALWDEAGQRMVPFREARRIAGRGRAPPSAEPAGPAGVQAGSTQKPARGKCTTTSPTSGCARRIATSCSDEATSTPAIGSLP